jgi:exodeoxyribonuclease-3
VTFRLLTYNIRQGGRGRETALAAVINSVTPDLVVFQEATEPGVIDRLAGLCGMADARTRPRTSLGFMSRRPPRQYAWHRPRLSRHAFLEITPDATDLRVFGVHLSAVHAAWTERRRAIELESLLRTIREYERGPHLLMGDFNTLAPGEVLDIARLPHRLKALVWLSGGRVRWRTIARVLNAGYVDGFKRLHPEQSGPTFPVWDPHIRLDYVFLPATTAPRLETCEVVVHDACAEASDHLPLLAGMGDR